MLGLYFRRKTGNSGDGIPGTGYLFLVKSFFNRPLFRPNQCFGDPKGYFKAAMDFPKTLPYSLMDTNYLFSVYLKNGYSDSETLAQSTYAIAIIPIA
jgi:hypothetical protein